MNIRLQEKAAAVWTRVVNSKTAYSSSDYHNPLSDSSIIMDTYAQIKRSRFINHANSVLHGAMICQSLREQNQQFKGSGGISQENRSLGFVPAFQDSRTGAVYRSRFSDGRHAPVHVMGGLPSKLVQKISDSGRVVALIDSVIAGFLRDSHFYTRRKAADFTNNLHASAW